jgi:hypothetical protein
MDKGKVLLQSVGACLLTGFAPAPVRTGFLDGAPPPPVDYPDSNSGDVTFIKATSAIGGRDAVEEYLVYGEAIARWLTTEAKHRSEVL